MVASFVAAVAALGAGSVVDNYDESSGNRDSANSASDGAEEKWSGDRQVISSEWGRISEDFDGEFAPGGATQEAFKTWSHQQIWDALNGQGSEPGVTESEVNAGADGWRRLVGQLEFAIDDFGKGVEQDISEKWGGKAANAAMEGTRTYTESAKKLPTSFQMVANGIDMIQGHLGQAKMSVPPPVDVSGFDEFVGHIPGNGVVKANKHRTNEAEALAQDVMTEVYQPGVTDVDGRTPILPPPSNPVTGPGETPPAPAAPNSPAAPGGPGSPTGTGDPNAPDTPSQPGQPGLDEAEDPPTQQPGQPNNTTPANSPNETQPTTPANSPTAAKPQLEDPVGRPNSTTMPNTPGAPSGPTSPGTPAPPGQGRSVPGNPNQPGQQPAAPRTTGAGAGRAGMHGAPAMAPPGARGRGGDDEDEHKTPDYLVQDRTTDLLGEQPKVLPPGGVIGE